MRAVAAKLAEYLPKQVPVFKDSLKLSQDHFIETKPRGELPPLPPLKPREGWISALEVVELYNTDRLKKMVDGLNNKE